MRYKFDSSGQTIIEAIVALTALLIVFTAISIVVVSGLANSQFAKNRSLANKYAQQGLEFVRNVHSNDAARFSAIPDGTYCLDNTVNPPTITTCSGSVVNVGGNFIRTMVFTDGTDTLAVAPCVYNQTRVDVVVKWSSGKCSVGDHFCHKATLTSCFFNQ